MCTEGRKERKVRGAERKGEENRGEKEDSEQRKKELYIKKRKGNSVGHIEPSTCSKDQK